MTSWLITSDIHLSDRPKDEYRFALFDWLAAQQVKHDVTDTFLLGDITDRKDNHSSVLVNKTTDSLLKLRPPVHILMGNHDFISPTNPFFQFLSYVEGIDFVSAPTVLRPNFAMVPHQPDQASLDRACRIIPPNAAVFTHQTFNGAIAETGASLSGLSASPIELRRPKGVWAGDIHRPQRLPPVTYVGAPFQVRFGDDFQPRVLLVKNWVEQDLHYPCLHKWQLRVSSANQILDNPNLQPGDQVKISITLAPEEVTDWAKHKQQVLNACRKLDLDVFELKLEVTGITPPARVKLDPRRAVTSEQIFNSYCQAEDVPADIRAAGFDVLKG